MFYQGGLTSNLAATGMAGSHTHREASPWPGRQLPRPSKTDGIESATCLYVANTYRRNLPLPGRNRWRSRESHKHPTGRLPPWHKMMREGEAARHVPGGRRRRLGPHRLPGTRCCPTLLRRGGPRAPCASWDACASHDHTAHTPAVGNLRRSSAPGDDPFHTPGPLRIHAPHSVSRSSFREPGSRCGRNRDAGR